MSCMFYLQDKRCCYSLFVVDSRTLWNYCGCRSNKSTLLAALNHTHMWFLMLSELKHFSYWKCPICFLFSAGATCHSFHTSSRFANKQDFYETLGVSKTATQKDIKKAYYQVRETRLMRHSSTCTSNFFFTSLSFQKILGMQDVKICPVLWGALIWILWVCLDIVWKSFTFSGLSSFIFYCHSTVGKKVPPRHQPRWSRGQREVCQASWSLWGTIQIT